MTKREVKDIAQSMNCEALYDGKERIMYIHGVRESEAVGILNQHYQRFSVVPGAHIKNKSYETL